MTSMPGLPDNYGSIVVSNAEGDIIDELHYDHKWHFPLIDDEEGVALERIDYSKPTQNSGNWVSAASTAGFGTPGYQNSQFKTGAELKADITISPKIFSPDNDGYEDYCFIGLKLPQPGFVANITIYDLEGREVRFLTKTATMGIEAIFRWDGLNDEQRPLPMGIYIVGTEIFNLDGKTKTFKNIITLAKKLK